MQEAVQWLKTNRPFADNVICSNFRFTIVSVNNVPLSSGCRVTPKYLAIPGNTRQYLANLPTARLANHCH